jgi:formate transporter FocA
MIEHIDSLLPAEMAHQSEQLGVNKANMPASKTLALAVLAGAFISFGAVFFISVTTGSTLPYGITRLIGGTAFSLGLVLVVVGGAELFTGNNLIIMAWANKRISTRQLLLNWLKVYIGNMLGAMFTVTLLFFGRYYLFASGEVGNNILNIAKAKCELGFGQAVALGILCNVLVCLAVWLSFSARTTAGKILSIVFPIAAFVTCGFEHSVANMLFIPLAIFVLEWGDLDFLANVQTTGNEFSSITWENYFIGNLLPVTIGNIIGGAVLVGLVYWFVYLRHRTKVS